MPENTYKEAEVCPHAKDALTPCYHKDGADCLTEDGCCPGCGIIAELLDIEPPIVSENIRFRQRAKEAEAELKVVTNRLMEHREALGIFHQLRLLYTYSPDMQEPQVKSAVQHIMKTCEEGLRLAEVRRKDECIHKLSNRLDTANAAYQRIFDEKIARCEYIAKLEKCNDKQREYIRKMEEKAYPKLEVGQQFDFTPAEVNFLPKCKWQFPEDGVVFCRKDLGYGGHGENYGKPCSKRCSNPEPESIKPESEV